MKSSGVPELLHKGHSQRLRARKYKSSGVKFVLSRVKRSKKSARIFAIHQPTGFSTSAGKRSDIVRSTRPNCGKRRLAVAPRPGAPGVSIEMTYLASFAPFLPANRRLAAESGSNEK